MAKKNNADKARENRKRYGYGERFYTNSLLIERLDESDWNFFQEIAGDARIRLYFSEYKKRNNGLKKYFLEEMIDAQNEKTIFLVIRLKDETPVGFVNLYYVMNGEWLCEYGILESYRKRGYMMEVLDNIYSRKEEFLRTIEANEKDGMYVLIFKVANDNIASDKLIKKFKEAHTLRGEPLTQSFFDCFGKQPGETWHRVRIG